MMFDNRKEAGRALGEVVVELDLKDPVVLGIPRGGVIVAAEVARRLGCPLDVIVPAKIRAPFQPELGLGAVAPDGSTYLDEDAIGMLGVSSEYLEREIAQRRGEIERRTLAYRGGREPAPVDGMSAIVVDDGIATGGTAIAAARAIRNLGPATITLAVPVAPQASLGRIEKEVDSIVCLSTPEPFLAVGRWYKHFDQVSDGEVEKALQQGVAS